MIMGYRMKHRLVLHIGVHRTATSALQNYLYQNIAPLKKKGFLYPFKTRRHWNLVNNIFSGAQTVKQVTKVLNTRLAAHKVKLHTIILSDEDICMRQDIGALCEFRDTFDVKVVYTLRRQDLWLESWFLQNIKWQWNKKLSHCTFDEFIAMRSDFHWIHYDRYVRNLEDVFGKENIILNIYEKQQMPDGPVDMFCDSIGLTDRSKFTKPDQVNASFSPTISEFMRCLPLNAAKSQYRNILTAACEKLDHEFTKGKKQSNIIIPHPERMMLMSEYQKGNQALAQRYFGRDDLFFDPLPEPDVPVTNMTLPADSYELMENFVSPLLKAVIEHQEKVSVPSPTPPPAAAGSCPKQD